MVSAWTTGGNLSDAIVRLQATPSNVAPKFSFGCGSDDGTASCNLGAVDATSAQRQLQAQSTVPATASTVKSVKLTVIGSAASLPQDPTASATVKISGTVTPSTSTSPTPSQSPTRSASPTATASPTTAGIPITPAIPITTTSPLPIGNLPGVTTGIGTSPTLSPGGNAANLFPTLQPSPGSSAPDNVKARPVAESSALPEGASVLGASLIGLAALALAFVLAVTRFSIRRRPAPAAPGAAGAAGAAADPKAQDSPAAPAAPAAAAAAAAEASESLPAKAADKAPWDAAPKPPEDVLKAAEDGTETPKAPEDPADPPADTNPDADA